MTEIGPGTGTGTGLITNADADLRIDPLHRPGLELGLVQKGEQETIRDQGKSDARHRRRKPGYLTLETQAQPIVDQHGNEYMHSSAAWAMDEPDYNAVDHPSLRPFVIDYVEKKWWPFRRKGYQTGMFPAMGPKAWAAVFEGGWCIRCLCAHEEPNPDVCASCDLTFEHFQRVVRMMEQLAELEETGGANEQQRQVLASRTPVEHRMSGLVVPKGA